MKIINKEVLSDGFLKLHKYNVEHNDVVFEREFLDVGVTVCALVHNTMTDKFIFVKQFRPGTANSKLVELPGGWLENNNPVQTIHNEVIEEVGYKPDKIEKMLETFFVPGYSSENLNIYYVTVSEKISEGGGITNEHEYIDIVELSRADILKLKPSDADAKTLMALSMCNLIKPYYIYNYNRMSNPEERIGGC